MRMTILTVFGAALVTASLMQAAAAAEHHRSHRAERAPVSTTEQLRNSNAAWPAAAEPDWSRYNESGLIRARPAADLRPDAILRFKAGRFRGRSFALEKEVAEPQRLLPARNTRRTFSVQPGWSTFVPLFSHTPP